MGIALLLVMVLASGCSGDTNDSDGVASPGPVSTSTVQSATTSSSTTAAPTTTTTTLQPAVPLVFDDTGVPVNGQTHGVLVTESGWVLPVLGAIPGGWRIWTPCGREADATEGIYHESVDVVIDPGHGGSTEPGAVSPGGIVEAELNLQISTLTAAALEAAGYTVILTRSSDVRVPIVTRAEIARALQPKAFISIHHNAGTNAASPTPGTEIYHQLDQPESRRLSGLLYEATFAALAQHDLTWVALSDAGAMSRPNRDGDDYYGVLRRPGAVTSALVEVAYVSNRAEAELLSTPAVQNEVADAIATAVDRFVTTNDPGGGYVDDPLFRGFASSGSGRTDNCVDPEID